MRIQRFQSILWPISAVFFLLFGTLLGFQLTETQRTRKIEKAVTRTQATPDLSVDQANGECNVPVGHYDYCKLCGPCENGQGDCDTDTDCSGDLICAADIGLEFELGEFVDVCIPPDSCPVEPGHIDYCSLCGPCSEDMGDCDSTDECAEGLTCKADIGNSFDWWWNIDVCIDMAEECPLDLGDPDYCTVCGPCEERQGDCDSDAECGSDLFCFSNVGFDYGFDSFIDVCLSITDDSCPVRAGHIDYCRLCGPCEENMGDCDGEDECESDLICVNNQGSRFGFGSSIDVCMAPIDMSSEDASCPLPRGHYDYCSMCGPCKEDQGDCDSDSECAEDLICMSDVGEFYDWNADVDVCRVEGEPGCPEEVGSSNYCAVCGPCEEEQGDCDSDGECEEGLICVTGAGPDFGFGEDVDVCLSECPVDLGHPDYCNLCGPCEDGEGNCRTHDECDDGLQCVPDIGEFVGLPPETDICVSSSTCTVDLGDYSFCKVCGPCEEGQGDCDDDNECGTGLVCVSEVGPDFGFAWDVDVCLPLTAEECTEKLGEEDYCKACGPCEEGQGDCNSDEECAEGLFCISNVGSDFGFEATVDVCMARGDDECSGLEGDWDYCRFCGPCEENQGDCDSDEECRIGLACVDDIGDQFGWPPGVDVCRVNQECPDLLGDNSYCSVCGPCEEGQGDCDNNNECREGLICVNNIGAEFNFPWETDVCIKPTQDTCPVSVGHYDYCALCGPCADGLGDCDSADECLPGLSCRENVGALFGLPADVDVCQAPTP